jgi:single-stranded-DNA-specific exonuclease
MAREPGATDSAAVSIPTTSRWIFPVPSCESEPLARELQLPSAAAQILYQRGFRDALCASNFLHPKIEDLHDPFLLQDMDRAVARIRLAIAGGEKIEIHGDYDVDGVTSTVVLKKALELAGADAGWHIPHRLHDGYGMQPAAVEEAAQRNINLIISVDNGIRAGAAITRANEHGIDVIVTDHHLPETELPPALAVINPNRVDCNYPNPNLCGAGVAFKLAHAILTGAGWSSTKLYRVLESFLKLVAIATVADIVPLTGENRVIVKHGLNGLGDVRNPGLRALLDAAGFADRVPDAGEVGFRIAPAINASGRMDSAGQAVRMFLTDDKEEASRIARELFALNVERQTAERAIVIEIVDRCLETPVTDADAALVMWGESWHRGVVGIVASRIVERYHRPAIILGVENGVAQGSGRSIEAFHLLDALEGMRELFTKFGGHAHACGLTLPASSLEEFRARMRTWAFERLTPEDMQPTVTVDAVLEFGEINDELWRALERLAPFGMGNRQPLFAARGVQLAGPPQVWKEKHLKLAAKQSGRTLMMKGWGLADLATELREVKTVDIAFEIERDWFGSWGLIVRACRACDAAAGFS